MENSYARGNVEGNSSVGGLLGHHTSHHEEGIIQSYSTGRISGNELAGGFIGKNDSGVSAGYWDTESSQQTDGLGSGSTDGVTGLTTDEMTGEDAADHMMEFDFKGIWRTTASYPVLIWQEEGPGPGPGDQQQQFSRVVLPIIPGHLTLYLPKAG